MRKMIALISSWFPSSAWGKMLTVFIGILGYFTPIKDVTFMLLLFFFMDIVFGYWKARKMTKAPFKPRIIWDKTVPRMVVVVVLLIGSFSLDEINQQTYIATHKLVGWFFGALLLYSIAENGYYITEWRALALFAKFAKKQIEGKTGMDIDEEDLS